MIDVVENLGQFQTFRGQQDEVVVKEITEYQQSKQFADDLRAIGVECVVLGGCRDEVGPPSSSSCPRPREPTS